MKLPELKFCDRKRLEGADVPDTWEWAEHKIAVYRPRLSFMMPRKTDGAIVLLLEQADDARGLKNFFVPFYETGRDSLDLLNRVRELTKQYEVQDLYSDLNNPEMDFVDFHNEQNKFRDRIMVMAPPLVDSSGDISYHMNLLKSLMQHGRERVFFPKGSSIAEQMSSVPEISYDITAEGYPALAALVYGIAALYHFKTQEPERGNKKSWDPWSKLKDLDVSKMDPWAAAKRSGFDPWEKLR
jgi:hypothetical protein